MTKKCVAITILATVTVLTVIYKLHSSSKIEMDRQINNTEQVEQEEKIKNIYAGISKRERKIYSQNKEDGVIEAIFDLLNIKNLKKYFVEIGTQSGNQTICTSSY